MTSSQDGVRFGAGIALFVAAAGAVFVSAAGGDAGSNLAAQAPQQGPAGELLAACGSFNPFFAVANLVHQGEGDDAASRPAVIAFQDTRLDDPALARTLATRAQVGAVYGLAFDAGRGRLYVGAYHKRGAPFGPGGPGQVYRVDLTDGSVAPFVAVQAGQDFHDPLRRNLDLAAAEYVGKVSLGDLEVDDAGDQLFVANLLSGAVHRFSLPAGAPLGSFRHGAAAEPWRVNARLFGLGWRDGWLYHGVVDSGESTSVAYTAQALVYRSRADGADLEEVARFGLDYGRAVPWRRWSNSLPAYTRPPLGQAMLTDIAFTADGRPVLGLRDRVTDMLAFLTVADARSGAGDVLATAAEGARFLVRTSDTHYRDRTIVDEALWGGLAAFPGLDQLVASALAPVDLAGVGALWLDNPTGVQWRSEVLADLASGSAVTGSSGLGDVEALCAPSTTIGPDAAGTATAVARTATSVAATATARATPGSGPQRASLPADYGAACGTDNPYLAGVCYDAQDWFASGYDWAAVVGFRDSPYDGPTDPPQLFWLAAASEVGAVWGLAFRRSENALYAAAYHKRLALFGPGGPGAIYRIGLLDGTVTAFVTVPDAGTDRHTGVFRDPDRVARDWAGKTSLGDLDFDEDQNELFVVNMHDRRIYRYEVPSGALLGSFAHGAAREPRADDMRPFGLKFHRGRLYHGVVDSAQRGNRPQELRGLVYESERDGADMRLVASFPLTYPRGVARVPGVIQSPGVHEVSLDWRAWRDDNNDLSDRQAQMSLYPQPMLSDIEFTAGGDMVIGLRDRHGDMTVARQIMQGQVVIERPGLPAGDTLLARSNGDTWDVETPGAASEHFGDRTSLSDEATLGALARVTGFDLIAVSTLLQGNANFSTTSYGLDETVVWYGGASGQRLRHELVCRLSQVPLGGAADLAARPPAAAPGGWLAPVAGGAWAAPPEPGVPAHNEYVPASNMGDLEELCGPLPPSPTPTATQTATVGPSPSASATPSVTASPSATPTPSVTPSPRVWTIYLPLSVRDRPCDPKLQHVDVVLIIDASFTMRDPTRAGRPKLEAAKEAARRFLDNMRFPGDQAAIVSFNVEATVNHALSTDAAALRRALDGIRNREYTRIDLGLEAAHGLLSGSSRRGVNRPVIVLLTDGRSNPAFSRQPALDAAAAIRRDGIALYTIGLGEDAEHADLRVMATTPGHYRYAPDGEDLRRIYEELAVEIPCPPSSWWPFR